MVYTERVKRTFLLFLFSCLKLYSVINTSVLFILNVSRSFGIKVKVLIVAKRGSKKFMSEFKRKSVLTIVSYFEG